MAVTMLVQCASTAPVAAARAVNRVVVPWRTELCVTPAT